MANIRRLADLNNNQNQNQQGQLPFQNPAQLFGSSLGQPASEASIRNESFLQMLKFNMCPRLTLFSGTTLLCFILLGFYVASLFAGPLGLILLSPSTQSLVRMGAIIPQLIATEHQYWRFFTSPFLNMNIITFLFNILFLLIMGGNLEPLLNWKSIIIAYYLGGTEGGMITCYFSQDNVLFTTPDQSFYGLFGLLFGYLILNWQSLGAFGPMRGYLMCWLTVILVFVVLGGSKATIFGTIFSMIIGLFVGLCTIIPMNSGDYESKCKIVGIVSTIFLLFISIFIFLQVE